MDGEAIVRECLERWKSSDRKTENFAKEYSTWIGQMSDELAALTNRLLQEFDYYSKEKVNSLLETLHRNVIAEPNVTCDNTIYCVLPSQRRTVNSSYEYFVEYKLINNMSKHVMIPDFEKFEDSKLDYVDNIVFIDDCSGSGKTFTDYLKLVVDKVRGKKIIYVVIHIMEKAIKAIEEYKAEEGLDIRLIYHKSKDEAFAVCSDISAQKAVFIEESRKLGIRQENDILGFEKTQALMAFYNDTPNNTLGIFWKNTKEYDAIFPRKDDYRPPWARSRQRKQAQARNNYINSQMRNKDE